MAEHDEQIAVVKWFKIQYPNISKCLIAIPNAQGLAKTRLDAMRMWKKLEREGAKKGVSDLFLAVPKNGYSGLWIEMKDKGKTRCSVSKEQIDWFMENIDAPLSEDMPIQQPINQPIEPVAELKKKHLSKFLQMTPK